MTGIVDALQARLRGRLVRSGNPDYDEARAVWNAMIDQRPAAIARCTGVADVIRCVDHARNHGLPLAVRGGGHAVAGTSTGDDCLLVDLGGMRAVHVDPAAGTARVQGGATLGDLDHETQAFGLAAPGGVVSTTGVAGLTLGGGFGWLSRRHGLAIDNLVSVDVVTADGRLRTASDTEHADLFWALRGGGGNYGVATSFVFRLHEVGPEILFGPTFYRLEDAPAVLRAWRDFSRKAPRDCCVWADLLTAPPLPFIPERFHGTKLVSLMQCHLGGQDEGRRTLSPLHGSGATPIADAVGPMPYTVAQSILDGAYEKGARNYWHVDSFDDLPDAALDALIGMAWSLPTAESDILLCQLGGAVSDVAPDATAYPHRTRRFIATPGARWREPADDDRCIAWLRGGAAQLRPHAAGGAYVNFITERRGRERDAFAGNYARLARIKRRYDPDNLFRLNQNVRPAA